MTKPLSFLAYSILVALCASVMLGARGCGIDLEAVAGESTQSTFSAAELIGRWNYTAVSLKPACVGDGSYTVDPASGVFATLDGVAVFYDCGAGNYCFTLSNSPWESACGVNTSINRSGPYYLDADAIILRDTLNGVATFATVRKASTDRFFVDFDATHSTVEFVRQ